MWHIKTSKIHCKQRRILTIYFILVKNDDKTSTSTLLSLKRNVEWNLYHVEINKQSLLGNMLQLHT